MSSPNPPEASISQFLGLVGQPARIQILLVIGAQAACVCHLEAVTGMRQASISQHLMILRKAGLVTTQRAGRHIFYQLCRPEVIGLLQQTAQLCGISAEALEKFALRPVPGCPCPQCNPGMEADLVCQKILPT